MKHSITYRNVPRETFKAAKRAFQINEESYNTYIDQLLWWNERVNLVSRDVPRETIANHIRHSLLLAQLPAYQSAKSIVDAGTGGGLPGLPLAIANPDKNFILNDIVSKKVLAVKQMVRKQSLTNVETVDQSVAELTLTHPFLLVSKHAFKINKLINLTINLPWKRMALFKGLEFNEELDGIDSALDISVYELYENSGKDFYKDKAILIVSR